MLEFSTFLDFVECRASCHRLEQNIEQGLLTFEPKSFQRPEAVDANVTVEWKSQAMLEDELS